MILSMSEQARIFLICVLAGAAVGFIYDLIRVFRRIVPHNGLFINIEDLLYWAFATLAFFGVMLMNSDYGEIRGFNILGAALGMVLYFSTLSPLFMRVSALVLRVMRKALLIVFRVLTYPFALAVRLLSPSARLVSGFMKRNAAAAKSSAKQSAKKVLRKSKNYARMRGRRIKKSLRIISQKK